MHDIYILGAGGMAREAFSILKEQGLEKNILGFVVEDYEGDGKIRGKNIFDQKVLATADKEKIFLLSAIGTPLKKRWIDSLKREGFTFEKVVDGSVFLGENISIEDGSIVCPNSSLTDEVKIGEHSIVNFNTSISHNTIIGSFTTVCPGVSIAGNVNVGDGCWIGIGATVIQGVKIGSNSFIGAGSVVISDIPENALAYGNPAKVIRKIDESEWAKLI